MPKAKADKPAERKIVGTEPALYPLEKLKANSWNPNAPTNAELARIRHGIETDGWISSQALLVWRKDDKGVLRNIIIDGEQRFTIAKELGYEQGLVSFVDGLTESQARAYTIKLNARRSGGGRYDDAKLADNLVHIVPIFSGQTPSEISFDLGLDGDLFRRITSPPPEPPPEPQRGKIDEVRQREVECPSCKHKFQLAKKQSK